MRTTLAVTVEIAGVSRSASSSMGEVVVVGDEEMDTRPICDTQAEA